MTLGKRIQRARKRLVPKMTQGALGARFGISDKAVSAWERDETEPEWNKIPELRRVLRVTYAWLLEGDGQPPDQNDPRVLLDDGTLTPPPVATPQRKAS